MKRLQNVFDFKVGLCIEEKVWNAAMGENLPNSDSHP